jgi:hypothetical protein
MVEATIAAAPTSCGCAGEQSKMLSLRLTIGTVPQLRKDAINLPLPIGGRASFPL